MNYIRTLQEQNQILVDELARRYEMVKELRVYLSSSKFRSGDELDGYVNIQDILNRLSDF